MTVIASTVLFVKLTLKENIRNRSLGYLTLFAIIASTGVLLFLDFSLQEQAKFIKDVCFSSMIFFSMIMAIFLGMRQIENDYESKTIYQLITNPVPLSSYVAGRVVAMMILIGGSLVMMCILFYSIMQAQNFGLRISNSQEWMHFDIRNIFTTDFMSATLIIFFQAIVINVITLFWSGIVQGPKLFLLCIFIYMAGQLSELLSQMSSGLHKLLSYILYVLLMWVPNLAYFNLTDSITLGHSPSWMHMTLLFVYSMIFVVIYSIMTYRILSKRIQEV